MNKLWLLSSYIHILLSFLSPAHSVAGCFQSLSHRFITVGWMYDCVYMQTNLVIQSTQLFTYWVCWCKQCFRTLNMIHNSTLFNILKDILPARTGQKIVQITKTISVEDITVKHLNCLKQNAMLFR